MPYYKKLNVTTLLCVSDITIIRNGTSNASLFEISHSTDRKSSFCAIFIRITFLLLPNPCLQFYSLSVLASGGNINSLYCNRLSDN